MEKEIKDTGQRRKRFTLAAGSGSLKHGMPVAFIRSVLSLPGSAGLNGMGATVMICAAF